jgi:hypothetical protein
VRRRTAGIVGVAAVAALVLGACTSDGSDAAAPEPPAGPADPIPVLAEAVAEAGEPIADGFTVPEGAVLLGRAIPNGIGVVYDGEPVIDEGWTAYLVVPGDPRPVVEAVVDEASATGFDMRVGTIYASGESLCAAGTDRSSPGYACGAQGWDGEPDASRRLSVDFVRTAEGDRPALSFLELRLVDSARPPGGGGPGPRIGERGPAAPDVADARPLPGEGEVIGEAFGPEDLYRFEVVAGSRLIGPLMSNLNGPGYVALFEVTGELEQVWRAYAQQHGEASAGDPLVAADGTTTRTSAGGGAGGPDFAITIVEPPEGDPLLRLAVGYD